MSRATLGDRVLGGVVGDDDPARAQLRVQRDEERRRVTTLRQRLATMDPSKHGRAMAAMEEALRDSATRLASIEQELGSAAQFELALAHGDSLDAQQAARAALRQRLQHLLLVVERHAPPSCDDAVRRLRREVNRELLALDAPINGGRSCD